MMHPFSILSSVTDKRKGVLLMYEPVYYKKRRRRTSCPVGVAIGIILILVLSGMGIWLALDPALDKVLALSTEPPFASTAPRDSQPPQLFGIQDIIIYAGDPVSYLSGVTATDDLDPEPQLDVDTREVDLSKPGTYTVTYTASDTSGNLATACANITVLRKEEGYADLETIYTLADELLEILLEGTTDTRQQVEAIYNWARSDIRYSGHSDREDWRQTAYNVIRSGEGDCFGYFAATKLMFERLGIPNIDVQKVRNHEDDSDHFWSLVSVDGEHYYHFDATPRYGGGDDFCLVTDAYLNAYSEKHKDSHNRDESLYPATPEEDL